jgi:guanine deaminase
MSRTVTEAAVFYGPIVNPKSTSSFLLLPNSLLAVAASGEIDWIEENVHPSSVQDVLARHGSLNTPLVSLKYGEFILPGFVDTHTVRGPSIPRRTPVHR